MEPISWGGGGVGGVDDIGIIFVGVIVNDVINELSVAVRNLVRPSTVR